MGTIIVGVDFDEASEGAIERAKAEAARTGADVLLVHVYARPVYAYTGIEPTLLPDYEHEIVAAARATLDELASRHGLRSVIRGGDAADELLAVVDETKAELVVVGTHGRRGLSHLLLGSVAEKVVRRSSVPVLVVPVRPARAAA